MRKLLSKLQANIIIPTFILFSLTSILSNPCNAQDISLKIIPANYIYAVNSSYRDVLEYRKYYDVCIHNISIVNQSKDTIDLELLEIEASLNDSVLSKTFYYPEDIESLAHILVKQKKLGLAGISEKLIWTDETISDELNIADTTRMNPNTAIVIPNTYLMFNKLPDKLTVVLHYKSKNAKKVVLQESIDVKEYSSKVKYYFPLKGTWYMKGMTEMGVLDHHRNSISGEFAVDLMRFGQNGKLYKKNLKKPTDWYSYGETVYAAADGKVVAAYGAEKQEWSRFMALKGESDESFAQRSFTFIQNSFKKSGEEIRRIMGGNYIIIEHADGEYSSYYHLKENSLLVKMGDQVKVGQPIAKVGGTGDSIGAHLHFEVTNSMDPDKSRGLPFKFENILPILNENGWYVDDVE